MDKHYYNPELIEAFVEDKLSAAEKTGFKNAMNQDPLLKNEVELQKDIINALKENRKAELKSRLSKIDVSAGPKFLGLKVAASVLVAGLLSYGIYSLVSNKDTSPVTELSEKQAIAPNTKATETLVQPSITETSDQVKERIQAKESKDMAAKPSTSSMAKRASKEIARPETSPEMMDVDNDQFHKEDNLNLPESRIAQDVVNKSGIDINVDASTENKFHYKYYNSKLFLYGDFDSKTYEILELNTNKGKQVYLNYDKNYYLLNSNQLTPTPLKKITDKKIIEELQRFNK